MVPHAIGDGPGGRGGVAFPGLVVRVRHIVSYSLVLVEICGSGYGERENIMYREDPESFYLPEHASMSFTSNGSSPRK
jgi:hypothetical protein